MEQTLTPDLSVLQAALERLKTHPFTRIDLGIQKAGEELASARRRVGNDSVVILLTDGKANPEPVETAIKEAELAKRAGITLFVIVLGFRMTDYEALLPYRTGPRLTISRLQRVDDLYAECCVIPPPDRFGPS